MATSLKLINPFGKIAAFRRSSRRASRIEFSPRAEVLWSMHPSKDSASRAKKVFPDASYPVALTELINKNRSGPNKDGSIRLAMDPSADLPINAPVNVEFQEDGENGDLYIYDMSRLMDGKTYVNQLCITSKTKLRPGDEVSFGSPNEPHFVMTRNTVAHA